MTVWIVEQDYGDGPRFRGAFSSCGKASEFVASERARMDYPGRIPSEYDNYEWSVSEVSVS